MKAACGVRHPMTALCFNNIAAMNAKQGDWLEAATYMEQVLAVRLSLDLIEHRDFPQDIGALLACWQNSGQTEKAKRCQSGNLSDLYDPVIQIESAHRAWVAEDPEKRHFGPPSPVTGATA